MFTIFKNIPLKAFQDAVQVCVLKRTKFWLGACWYKPSPFLCLGWDDDVIYQVAELLEITPDEALWVMKLLQVSGKSIVFATYSTAVFNSSLDEDEDEDEFDDDGWLFEKPTRRKKQFQDRFVGDHHRYLGLLSGRGLTLEKDIVFYDGLKQVFFPINEVSIPSDRVVIMSRLYEHKDLLQVRFCLQMQIFCLLSSSSPLP